MAGKGTAGTLWCSAHLPLRHTILTFSREKTAQLSKPRALVNVSVPVLLAKRPIWRHHHMKHQESNTLDTSGGISDSRMPNLQNKKIHVLFCRQIHCKAVTSHRLFREKIGSPGKFSPWWTEVSCYTPVWKAKLTWSHTAQRADLSDILLFQVEAIVCYSLFFFTERQTIHLLTGVNNTHWKEKQERGRDSAWKKNHQFLFQM